MKRLPEYYAPGTPASETMARFAAAINTLIDQATAPKDARVRLPLHDSQRLPTDGGPGELRLWWNPATSEAFLIAHVGGGWRKVSL